MSRNLVAFHQKCCQEYPGSPLWCWHIWIWCTDQVGFGTTVYLLTKICSRGSKGLPLYTNFKYQINVKKLLVFLDWQSALKMHENRSRGISFILILLPGNCGMHRSQQFVGVSDTSEFNKHGTSVTLCTKLPSMLCNGWGVVGWGVKAFVELEKLGILRILFGYISTRAWRRISPNVLLRLNWNWVVLLFLFPRSQARCSNVLIRPKICLLPWCQSFCEAREIHENYACMNALYYKNSETPATLEHACCKRRALNLDVIFERDHCQHPQWLFAWHPSSPRPRNMCTLGNIAQTFLGAGNQQGILVFAWFQH